MVYVVDCGCVDARRGPCRVDPVDAQSVGAGGVGTAGADRVVGRSGCRDERDRGAGRGVQADGDRVEEAVRRRRDRWPGGSSEAWPAGAGRRGRGGAGDAGAASRVFRGGALGPRGCWPITSWSWLQESPIVWPNGLGDWSSSLADLWL